MDDKPFSPSCERNRDPILAVLRDRFAASRHVLEIGSGTGQHAVHFAEAMPWLTWQCSDRADYLPGITQWLDEAALPNTPPVVELELSGATPVLPPALHRENVGSNGAAGVDAVFTANTLHIMGWTQVEAFFACVGEVLVQGPVGTLVAYGPFNDSGIYSSDSNREFDAWLKARDPRSGIRDIEAVDALARAIGLRRIANVAMPANNRCVVWQRQVLSPA